MAPKTPETPNTPKPRKTAAQRREEAEQARQAAQAEFETNRSTLWNEIWMKAMRLALLRGPMHDFCQEHWWWFEDFSVDAKEQSFRITESYDQRFRESALTIDLAETALDALNRMFERMDEYEQEQERKRLAELEEERKRQAALAKLDAEDRRVLGLSK